MKEEKLKMNVEFDVLSLKLLLILFFYLEDHF